MHLPYIWQLTAEDAHRFLRSLNVFFQRRLPHFRNYKKAWSY